MAEISFLANLNDSSQTGVADATITKIAFANEVFDNGGYFNISTYGWTPPSGLIMIGASLHCTGTMPVSSVTALVIYKNAGGIANRALNPPVANDGGCIGVATFDRANGTDVYYAYGYIDVSSGTGTFDGNVTKTLFWGFWVCE